MPASMTETKQLTVWWSMDRGHCALVFICPLIVYLSPGRTYGWLVFWTFPSTCECLKDISAQPIFHVLLDARNQLFASRPHTHAVYPDNNMDRVLLIFCKEKLHLVVEEIPPAKRSMKPQVSVSTISHSLTRKRALLLCK